MFFSALCFSSIDFPQINSIAFLLIPISPPCSLPHQHEQIKNKTLLLNIFYCPSNKQLNLIIKCIFLQKVFDNAWMISGLKLSSTLPKVANKSWKQRQIKGDRWRPAKNPPMTKLVSLWFWFEGKVYRSSEWITLFVDQCFYNTPTEQSSPFM